jgi:hypothetical protein
VETMFLKCMVAVVILFVAGVDGSSAKWC